MKSIKDQRIDNETRYMVNYIHPETGLQRRICYGELQLKIWQNKYDVISCVSSDGEHSIRDLA